MTHSTLAHAQWRVLRNHEGRYSVYPAARPAPDGWDIIGDPASREACLETLAARRDTLNSAPPDLSFFHI